MVPRTQHISPNLTLRHQITVQGKNLITVTDEVPKPLISSGDNVRTQLLATPDSYKSKPSLNKVKVTNSFAAIS